MFFNHGFTLKIVGTDLRLDLSILFQNGWLNERVRHDQRSRQVTVGDKICLIFLDEL